MKRRIRSVSHFPVFSGRHVTCYFFPAPSDCRNSSTILEFSLTFTREKDWHVLRKRLQCRRVSTYKQLPRSLTITVSVTFNPFSCETLTKKLIHVMPGLTRKLHKKQVNKRLFEGKIWRCRTYFQYNHWRFNVEWLFFNFLQSWPFDNLVFTRS